LQLITKPRLQDLVREIDPSVSLDEDVEDILLQIADEFVESVINGSCLLAKHRRNNKVEVKDVQLHLERNWNMWIPGGFLFKLYPSGNF
jgi:transcription initiation factor TFIID subunit 12